MSKQKRFKIKLFFQHLEAGHMISPEIPLTAPDERTAEALLSKYVADYEIRGWMYVHATILSVEDVDV